MILSLLSVALFGGTTVPVRRLMRRWHASERQIRRMSILSLFAGGASFIAAMLLLLSCDENVYEGSPKADLCQAVDGGAWAAVLLSGPPLIALGGLVSARVRGPVLALASLCSFGVSACAVILAASVPPS